MMQYLAAYIYLLPVVLISSIISLLVVKHQPLHFKLFPFFIMITLMVEVSGTYLALRGISNLTMYNYFVSLEFIYYMFVLASVVYSRKFKRLIQGFLWAYLLFSIININFIQPNGFVTYSYSIGSVLVVGSAILYFYDLFYTTTSVKLVTEPAFWVSSALLFYYCCTYPIMVSTNFLTSSPYLGVFLYY